MNNLTHSITLYDANRKEDVVTQVYVHGVTKVIYLYMPLHPGWQNRWLTVREAALSRVALKQLIKYFMSLDKIDVKEVKA